MKIKHLVWLWAAVLCSCTSSHSNVPNTIPAVGNSLAKIEAHIESADRLIDYSRKGVDKFRQTLLTVAHKELTDARGANRDAASETKTVQVERDRLEVQKQQLADELTKLKSGWGYRLQQFVHKTFVLLAWGIGSLVFLHFALGIAGLAVNGPVGAVLARLGVVINPFAWFQSIRDNIHFKRQLSQKESQ